MLIKRAKGIFKTVNFGSSTFQNVGRRVLELMDQLLTSFPSR
jgi:hypothetical protein